MNNNKFNKNGLVIGVIYRHGHDCQDLYEKLCEQLILLNAQKTEYIIVGDFNLDVMKYNLDTDATICLNNLRSAGCTAFINKPTRIDFKKKTATCIDHVYSNIHTEYLENYILQSGVSDHYGTLSKIEGISQENGRRDIYYRKSKLSDEKWEEFNADFQDSVRKNVPFPHLLNANSLAAAIKDAYQSTIDKFMPLKKRSIIVKNEPDRPWITSGFKVSIDHMYELLRISRTSQSLEDYEKYKNYRNKLAHLKSKAKDKYYRDKSELYGRDISKTWQLIN